MPSYSIGSRCECKVCEVTDPTTVFGLTASNVRAIRAVLDAHDRVVRADIYGSRAMGTFRPGSDIDLTLHGDLLTMSDLLAIDRQIDDLELPYKVDLSLYSHIANEALRSHIDRIGLPIYEVRSER